MAAPTVTMAPASTDTFSFQPWTRETTDESSLKHVLARVNLERGHFRTITEASLQEEIAGEGALELSSSEDEGEDDEEEDEKTEDAHYKPSTRAELFKAKNDMLANIRAAEQEILMMTEFVSLLLSKDAPKLAVTTMSAELRSAVPMGSLGMDLWQRMPVDQAREAQDELLATGVRLNSLQRSADSLLSAANRLNANVRKETEYWNQILSISQRGWNVSRIPGPQHKLGVRFGFSESASEFSRKGIAALNMDSDGTVLLDRGIGSRPKALRVVLRKNREVVGTSKVPTVPDAEETTLEARIRYARDSLFDEELYYELIRESRTLASLGVGMKGSAVRFASSGISTNGIDVSLDLVALDDDFAHDQNLPHEEDALAQAIVLAARLLLSRAHRDKLKKRSEIPPPLSDDKSDERPLFPILRPVMAFVMHRAVLEQLNAYIAVTSKMLTEANIQTSHQDARFKLGLDPDLTNAESLISLLMQPWASTAKITISPPESEILAFEFKVETTLAYGTGPIFTLTTPAHTTGQRVDSIDELVAAADAEVASGLAVALGRMLSEDWFCLDYEALLIKSGEDNEDRRPIQVTFSSEQMIVSVSSLSAKSTWRLNGESSEKGFWDAVRGLAES